MAVSSGQKCSCPSGEPHRRTCLYQQCLCIGRRFLEPHDKSCPRVRPVPGNGETIHRTDCPDIWKEGRRCNCVEDMIASNDRQCTCAPPGMPTTQHAPPCPALNSPSQWNYINQLSVIELHNSDRVLFCFGDEEISDYDRDRTLSVLTANMQGIEFGVITGVSGVLIQRGSDNDSDGSTDDA